jgi:hypothetical protein
LQGTAYEVHEAFCVVFRRGGPRYELPPLLQSGSWKTHLILIDVAPASKSGSRSTEAPIVLEESAFIEVIEGELGIAGAESSPPQPA